MSRLETVAIEELLGEAKQKTYKVNGKRGVWRTSKTGKKIFIPLDGSAPTMNKHAKKAAAKPGWRARVKKLVRSLRNL